MAITPQTDLMLIKSPLELDNLNQLTFSSESAQATYFASLPHLRVTDFTYQRKDNVIRYPAHIDSLYEYNYVMYRNSGYSSKYFYAFITKMEYINDNMTNIYIKTDTYQTWMFDLQFKKSFVEREHVNDDTIGKHTVPEQLETGEYKVYSSLLDDRFNSFVYMLLVTEWMTQGSNPPLATNFGGVPYAGGAYVFRTLTEMINVINGYPQDARADAIYGCYMIPKVIVNHDFNATLYETKYEGQTSPVYLDASIDKPTTLDGYSPKNKKVLTFPYTYLTISNNNGSYNTLKIERFSDNKCNFIIQGVPVMGGSIKLIPKNYNGVAENGLEGIIAGKYPTLNWSADEYTNWLTQNGVNIGLGIGSSALTIAGGVGLVATGAGALAGVGAIVGGSMSIAQQLGQIYEHSLQPNSARGNVNGGDINVCASRNTFIYEVNGITSEYAKIIDDFFSSFGYKVNSYKVPNITGRRNWNYVKCDGVNIEGSIPQEDMQEIKSLFNNGITLWHNPSTFLDYSQNNDII